jgi:hypothetical protein
MSDIKARYVGHPEGCYLPTVPVGDGETRGVQSRTAGSSPRDRRAAGARLLPEQSARAEGQLD